MGPAIVILGAGPAGLGAASALSALGDAAPPWLLLETSDSPGGLASTDATPEGFFFDRGGHVIFSHCREFDAALDAALPRGEDWRWHARASAVRCNGSWVPYPFQNNVAALPEKEREECIAGMVEALEARREREKAGKAGPPADFDELILRTMGRGIADLFMRPYNAKVWTVPPSAMSCSWIGERVAVPDLAGAVAAAREGRLDPGWGPNARFRFPARGGTGAIWKGVAGKLDQRRVRYGCRLVRVDTEARKLVLADGTSLGYQRLISTVPLDTLVGMLHPPRPDLSAASSRLVRTTVHVVGLGIRGRPPPEIAAACWLYFPDPQVPFYRATVFSNYSEHNVPPEETFLPTLMVADGSPPDPEPRPGPYWSLMLEIPSLPSSPPPADLIPRAVSGAIHTGILPPSSSLVSLHSLALPHGYPVPTLSRDSALETVIPALADFGIAGVGRFGGWRYELGNQDHAFGEGWAAARGAVEGMRREAGPMEAG
ncbi:hypothetical protein DFJ74DRAFT_630685 [Hyaloraphidium curvatum]|nr:hypothetical protein DFJ74DRAFT_630685 [Hyaloraphidium curvatum]